MNRKPYHGIVKCQVLVPADLLHPVLPYRSKGKLLFPNCRTCADNRSEQDCVHTESERAIEGVWASCEFYRAMDKGLYSPSFIIIFIVMFGIFSQNHLPTFPGCRVVQVIEVYHYPEEQWSQYDKEDEKTGMFTEYINCNLKKKQEASGWPAWVESEEQRIQYISEYKSREKIDLDETCIERNEGRRALSKLMLNSFWVSCSTSHHLS
jgi:hypothetical protein